MNNKEIYDAAVANGLEFTYFHGEDIVPEEFYDTIKETFWEMELESANRNAEKNFASNILKQDMERDDKTSDDTDKRVPNFIKNTTNVSEGRKAVAYDCYSELRYGSNGYGTVGEYELPEDAKFNDDRGFSGFFDA